MCAFVYAYPTMSICTFTPRKHSRINRLYHFTLLPFSSFLTLCFYHPLPSVRSWRKEVPLNIPHLKRVNMTCTIPHTTLISVKCKNVMLWEHVSRHPRQRIKHGGLCCISLSHTWTLCYHLGAFMFPEQPLAKGFPYWHNLVLVSLVSNQFKNFLLIFPYIKKIVNHREKLFCWPKQNVSHYQIQIKRLNKYINKIQF